MPSSHTSKPASLYAVQFILLSAASIAGALLGFSLLPQGASAALVWPSSAIGIAALFLYGYDLWPAILLSITGILLMRGGSIPVDIAVAVSNTVEALLGAYILRTYINFNPLINTLRNGIGVIVASLVPTLISGGIIAVSFYFLGRTGAESVQQLWVSVWIGHAVTCLSFMPFAVRWLYRPLFTKTQTEIAEGIVIFSTITVTSFLLFWTTYSSVGGVSLVYILIFPLLWAAMRSGPRGTTLALAIVSLVSTSGVLYGSGTLSTSYNSQTIFLLQILIGVLDLIFILIAAIIEERKDTTNSLAANVQQLSLAIETIRGEDQAKTNFLAILAHELRNPLSPIVSSVELLKNEATTERQKELIETIESHTHTISLLLNDLLDITRITHNKFELRREHVTVQHVLKRSCESAHTLLAARKHDLRREIEPGETWLNADPVRLEQVFVNLLNNAAKYTDEGGIITLAAKEQGRHIIVSIKDNGIGMAPDKMRGIFELFGQIRDIGRGSGGLGVGLSLTKRLVELHGGTVEARSEGLGKGSEFIVRLPLLPLHRQQPTKAPRLVAAVPQGTRPSPHTEPLRVLVVDDNQPAANGLGKLLEHAGHTVTLAFDGASAITTAKNFNPHVVILDIGLPDMDGYEVCKQIRQTLGTELRIIAVTGYGQEEHRTKTTAAGFNAHLVKPVSIADVEAVLR